MKKKAILDVQFNWIFIAVAGALILMFFTSIVVKQRGVSEDSISSTILVNLEPILTGATVSTGTVNILEIPKKDIEFSCDNYQVGKASRGLRDKIVFAPDVIRGTQLYSWALGFNAPFKVTNFLYLTSPQVRYIVIGNGDLYDDLKEKIPEELGFEFHDTPPISISNENNYRVKFVYVGTPLDDGHLSDLVRMKDKHVTAISLPADGSSGKVTFHEKLGGSWRMPGEEWDYIYLSSVIAAIFSQDEEMYECGMKKAFEKLNVVAEIYAKRSAILSRLYGVDGNSQCAAEHDSALNELSILSNKDSRISMTFPNGINSMSSPITALNGINQRTQIFSCALIY